MMKGWKTYAASALYALLGLIEMLSGQQETGVEKLLTALALAGVGHKLDKLGQ